MNELALDELSGTIIGDYRLKHLFEYSKAGPIFLAHAITGVETYHLQFLIPPGTVEMHSYNDKLNRFNQLARQLVALRHPHILPILDYGIYQDNPYIVTPKLAIRSLRSRLSSNGAINVFTVGRYLDQITAALAYAHNHGVIHGNLTLDTIFIRLNGQAIVANFGVQHLLELSIFESARYHDNAELAPEQRNKEQPGSYTDVYALGAVLYQLLTGKTTYPGTISLNNVSSKPSQRELPPDLNSVITIALAQDPKQRYQQIDALANAYHQAIDLNKSNRVPLIAASSSPVQTQQTYVAKNMQSERQITDYEWSGNNARAFQRENDPMENIQPTLLTPRLEKGISVAEDDSDDPTLKRIPALPKQATPKRSTSPDPHQDLEDNPTPIRVLALPKQMPLPATLDEESSKHISLDQHSSSKDIEAIQLQRGYRSRLGVLALLILLFMSSAAGIMLITRQYAVFSGITKFAAFLNNSGLLLGLCIALTVGFTVSFNIISRMSLANTKYEAAYTIVWQMFCALLAPLFLLFDRFSVSFNPQVMSLFLLSIALWALVDAFLFSAFKYEEVSILSAIFPLNFLFTFVVSVVFFQSPIRPTIVIGFLIVMFASLLVGLYHTRFRPSKGVIFGLLYSFFLGIALGLNSEVVKNFSIAPYMFAAFLFPALTNLFIFLRPKRRELRYELKTQWKKILLNAAVMDASFFFLLKAFQLGNVPQVVALTASSTLITALAGVVLLKEDKYVALKITAAVLATAGLILIQM